MTRKPPCRLRSSYTGVFLSAVLAHHVQVIAKRHTEGRNDIRVVRLDDTVARVLDFTDFISKPT